MRWRDYEVQWDNALTMVAAAIAAWSYTGNWEAGVMAMVLCYLFMQ